MLDCMGTPKCKWATLHWIRFGAIETPESLNLASGPYDGASWKIGPDGPVGPDGYRLPRHIWCAAGLFTDRHDMAAVLDRPEDYLPTLPRAQESWHAFVKPIAHRGDGSHLDREVPARSSRLKVTAWTLVQRTKAHG